MNNCPFCSQQVQGSAFASEAGFLAVYNHAPILPGHSLIIPDRHIKSLFELTEDEISSFFSFARKITAFISEYYKSEAYDWSLQEGESAGQSVEHLHLHIIPRKAGDLPEGEDWYIKLQEQQNLPIDHSERKVLNEWEYNSVSQSVKEKWQILNKLK